LLRTGTTDLLRYEALRTTEAKAKEIRRMAEKVITRGKKNTLHSRRLAATVLTDGRVLRKLFDELGPRYADRPGGYTRIMKLGPRQGDAAEMAIIELLP
jgi:large subunit ribosomal protein L17